jgi:hypothetical protein
VIVKAADARGVQVAGLPALPGIEMADGVDFGTIAVGRVR